MGYSSANTKHLLSLHSYKRNFGQLCQVSTVSKNKEVLFKEIKETRNKKKKTNFSLREGKVSENLESKLTIFIKTK